LAVAGLASRHQGATSAPFFRPRGSDFGADLNYTDTGWFHAAAVQCAELCFTRGRIRFVGASGEIAAPTQGQAFFYLGPGRERFRSSFASFGFIR
jgi:hypothetical protein